MALKDRKFPSVEVYRLTAKDLLSIFDEDGDGDEFLRDWLETRLRRELNDGMLRATYRRWKHETGDGSNAQGR